MNRFLHPYATLVLPALAILTVAAMVMLSASTAAAHGPDCSDVAGQFRHCHDYGQAGDAPHAGDGATYVGKTPADLEWRTVRDHQVSATVTADLPRQCRRIVLGDEGHAVGHIQAGDDRAEVDEPIAPRRVEIKVCSEGAARIDVTGFIRYQASP